MLALCPVAADRAARNGNERAEDTAAFKIRHIVAHGATTHKERPLGPDAAADTARSYDWLGGVPTDNAVGDREAGRATRIDPASGLINMIVADAAVCDLQRPTTAIDAATDADVALPFTGSAVVVDLAVNDHARAIIIVDAATETIGKQSIKKNAAVEHCQRSCPVTAIVFDAPTRGLAVSPGTVPLHIAIA